METKVAYAVKKMEHKAIALYDFLFDNEYKALIRIEKLHVPRVVKFYDIGGCSDGAFCLILQ